MRLLPLLALAWPAAAGATQWVGGDWGGADLITQNGDTMTGTFTNVGLFVVPAGATVRAVDGQLLEVRADVIEIDGTLDATGAGNPGGGGAAAGAFGGSPGIGPAGGNGGNPGPCINGGGGGGGGYGGLGGRGGYVNSPGGAAGGPVYGTTSGTDIDLGSGGGGSGSDCYADGEPGGAGGGAIILVAGTLLVDGTVRADGDPGEDHTASASGGGGGGSGGAVGLDADVVEGFGTVSASGGDGGDTPPPPGLGGGGGGGGGGRIKVLYGALVDNPSFLTDGGVAGDNQDPPYMSTVPLDGAVGTVSLQATDPDSDADGVLVPDDNCPTVPNPAQDNRDGDRFGDDCDRCPDDPTDDSDYDGICDGLDTCPGGDDAADADGDGAPDFCDACPDDDPDDSDGDGVCDSSDVCDGLDDSVDTDGDDVPDACDICPDAPDPEQLDTDDDGLGDGCDCGPLDASFAPGAPELCDGLDNDCDDEIDEEAAEGGATFFADEDGDGQGDPGDTITACTPPVGYVDNALDCDDTNTAVRAFGRELCDGLDNDCDGQIEPDSLCNPPAPAEEGGCGCASSPGELAWLAGLLPLWLSARGRGGSAAAASPGRRAATDRTAPPTGPRTRRRPATARPRGSRCRSWRRSGSCGR